MKSQTRQWFGRAAIVAAFLAAILLTWKLLPVDEWLIVAVWHMFDLRWWGVLLYFLLYVLLVCVSFPTTPLNVGAGILFSFWVGVGVALAAGFAAATLSFLLVRFVAGDWIRARLGKLPRYDDMMKMMDHAGLQVVCLVRLNPFIPSSLKNYGFSLAGVPLRTYLLGTALGQTPVTVAHVYLGWAGGLAIMARDEPMSGESYVLIGVGAALSIALLALIWWWGRKKALPSK